jgi:DNA polymerase II large subunit
VPTCIFPLIVDQPFWAQKIVEKGAGMNTVIPLKDLTEAFLEEQICHCLQETVAEKARALGEKIRAEAGAEESVDMFLEHCRNMLLPRQQDGSPLTVQYADSTTTKQCMAEECSKAFSLFTRHKRCAACGGLFCSSCSADTQLANYATPQRCCKRCIASQKAGPR